MYTLGSNFLLNKEFPAFWQLILKKIEFFEIKKNYWGNSKGIIKALNF
jgi:hypothetical protein